jgi:hypothetical protein
MIETTDTAISVLSGSVIKRYVRIESWLGETLLASEIPIIDASEEQDAGLRVPERLTFQVPAEDAGVVWVPSSYTDPLGAYGQQVRVSLGVESTNGVIEWLNRGWFLINTTEMDGDVLTVEALGLLSLIDEAVLPNEYQPRAASTFVSVCRALIEPGLTIDADEAPADRSVPTTVTYSDNRLDALLAVLDAWPANIQANANGQLEILPISETDPIAADAVLTLTDGHGGTVISAAGSTSREGAFNGVVAKGQYPDSDPTKAGQEITQVAYDTDPTSPYRQGGPFSPYLVPYAYASPLMSTPAQVLKSANTVLKRLRRKAARTVQVVCVPDPRIELGDVVLLTNERLNLTNAVGVIDAFYLPYLAQGGAMTLTVRLEA